MLATPRQPDVCGQRDHSRRISERFAESTRPTRLWIRGVASVTLCLQHGWNDTPVVFF